MLHGIFHKEDKVIFRLWSDIFPPTHAFQEYELHLSTMDDMLMYEQFIIIILIIIKKKDNNNNNKTNNKDFYYRKCLLDVHISSIRFSTQHSLPIITTWFNNNNNMI